MMKIKKVFAILGLVTVLLMLPGCSGCSLHLNFLNRESKENIPESGLLAYSSDEVREICRIQLIADRTDFYKEEDGTFTLTVTVPAEIPLEDVELELTDGENTQSAGMIRADEFRDTGDGMLSVSKTLALHTDKCGKYELRAYSGKYRSSSLTLFTTPRITIDQVLESVQVGEDLAAELSEKYDRKISPKKLAKVAEKILKNDPRVAAARREDTMVYYTTTSSVAGAFNAVLQDPEVLSSGGEETDFNEKSNAINAFEKYGSETSTVDPSGNPTLLFAGSTTTNGNSLILCPASEALENDENDRLESIAENIRKKADGDIVDLKKDDAAVHALISRDIVNYGSVFLHTHGGIVEAKGEQCGVHFLMYQTKYGREDVVEDILNKKLKECARIEFAATNGKAGTDEETEAFCRNFYGNPNDVSARDWRLYILTSRTQNNETYEYLGQVFMSSTYIMQRYADRNFDNTVFYLGACHSASYLPFIDWLIQRGCRIVLGYTKTVNTAMSLLDLNDIFDQLMKKSPNDKWRLKNLDEATENKENYILNYYEDVKQSVARLYSFLKGTAITMHYFGSGDYFYSGTGTIHGKVYYSYEEDPSSEDLKPASDINIASYLFLNQKFTTKTTVITGKDGSFEMPDMRSGLYVLKAVDPKGAEKLVSVILDQEETGEGKILLPAEPVVDVIVENEDGERITDAEVIFAGADGSAVNGELTAIKANDQAFQATLTEQDYEITVVPNNNEYMTASVSFSVPSGYPRRHEVTVTLKNHLTLSGMVYDDETKEVLSGVTVTAEGPAGEKSEVSENGHYSIKGLTPGDYLVSLNADGYESQSIPVSIQESTELPAVYLKRDNERKLLLQYLNEILIPEYGTADGLNAKIKHMASSAAYNEVYGQLNNRILGSMIADFDLDSHPEMVVIQLSFREDPDPSNMYPLIHYTITYYDVKEKIVREVDSAETEAALYYTVGHFMTLISGNPDECAGGPKQDPGSVRLVTSWYGWDEYSATKRQVTAWSFTEDSIEYDFGASLTGANQHAWIYGISSEGEKKIVFEEKQDTVIAGDYVSFEEAYEKEFTSPLAEIGLADFMSGVFLAKPSTIQEYADQFHIVSYIDTEIDGTVYTGYLQDYISVKEED